MCSYIRTSKESVSYSLLLTGKLNPPPIPILVRRGRAPWHVMRNPGRNQYPQITWCTWKGSGLDLSPLTERCTIKQHKHDRRSHKFYETSTLSCFGDISPSNTTRRPASSLLFYPPTIPGATKLGHILALRGWYKLTLYL